MKCFYKFAWGLVAALLLSTAAQALPITTGDTFTLQLYDVDDVMSAYISNSQYTDQLILKEPFGASFPAVNISSYIAPGANDIFLQLYNGPAGWTYGYDFQINGVSYDSGQCGTFNVYGCDNNAYGTGNVWSHDIAFNVIDPNTPVPEPPTLALLISGFAILLGLSLRRHRRTLPA